MSERDICNETEPSAKERPEVEDRSASAGCAPSLAEGADGAASASADRDESVGEHDGSDGAEAPESQDAPAYGNPGLPVASVIFGIVGLILGGYVSWLLSVLAGIVAIALSIFARKQNSPWPAVARAGLVMGIVDIVASIALVGIVLWRLSSIGLL